MLYQRRTSDGAVMRWEPGPAGCWRDAPAGEPEARAAAGVSAFVVPVADFRTRPADPPTDLDRLCGWAGGGSYAERTALLARYEVKPMGTAFVRVSGELLASVLHFPPGTEFTGGVAYDPQLGCFVFTIRSPAFPAVPAGSPLPNANPLYQRFGPGDGHPVFAGWGGAEGADVPHVVVGEG